MHTHLPAVLPYGRHLRHFKHKVSKVCKVRKVALYRFRTCSFGSYSFRWEKLGKQSVACFIISFRTVPIKEKGPSPTSGEGADGAPMVAPRDRFGPSPPYDYLRGSHHTGPLQPSPFVRTNGQSPSTLSEGRNLCCSCPHTCAFSAATPEQGLEIIPHG